MLLIKWIINSLAIMFAAFLVPGVEVASFWTAFWLVIFLGLVNIIVKPILIILTLPINIFTFGLFIFVINASLVLFVSTILKGFLVAGFWPAMLFSIIISAFSYLLNTLYKDERGVV